MVFPIHAARSLRLRLGASARTGEHELERCSEQVDDVGQSQRLFLRAGSRDRKISFRTSLCESKLGQRSGYQRPPHYYSATSRPANVSGHSGWNELVFAVV